MADTTLADALSLITKVSSATNKRLTLLEKVIGKKAPVLGQETGPKKPRQVVQKAAPVIVTDFGKKAEQDLGRLGGDPGQGGKDGEGGAGGKGGIGKLLGGALLVLGGLAALVQGLMTDGPLKGLLKILAKGGIIGGIKLFASSAGKALKGFGKKFAKIMPKNLFKNVITAAKGFLSKIGKFLLKPFAKIAGKGGAKALFGTIGKLFFKFLKPVLKRIPGIGSLISWGFAISRFKSGDLVGGLIDVASGIATLFPGIGTGISIGLDVLNAFLDTKKGKEEKVEPGGAPGGIGAFFGKIKDKIMNNFPIKNLVQFYTGVGKVMTGDFKEGFTQMAFAIPFMKPLAEFLFGETDEETGEKGKGAISSLSGFFGPIKDKLLGKVLNILPEKILGVSVRNRVADLLGINLGAIEDDPEEAAKNAEAEKAQSQAKIKRMIAEEQARIKRSESGENEYWGREGKGVEKSQKKIAELEAKLAGRQDGGPVNKNTPYMVGEAGPELFIPKNNGDVVDNKTVNILKNTLDKKTFVDTTNINIKIASQQIAELEKNNMLLQAILEKSNASTNVITNNSTVTNMNSQRGLRDLQEAYS